MAHRPSAAEDDFTCSPDIQYEIVRHKARGHIADIFEAKELGTGKVLAIKLFPQPKNRTQHMSVKFAVRHEVRMLELVQGGPHIIVAGTVRYLDHPNRMTELPMKYYAHNLSQLLRDPKFEQDSAESTTISAPPYYYTFLEQMLAALAFVHGKGIIHRNVQPQNIHYNDTNNFVLADFANARLAIPPPCGDIDLGACVEYSAPEMLKSEPQTPAIDVWSLGMLCLMMLNMHFISPGPGAVEGMKESIWHRSMAELARLSGRPELEMMIRVSADERCRADHLLGYLQDNPSIRTESWLVGAELAEYFRRIQSEGGVPDDLQVVPAHSEEVYDGLSQTDLLSIYLRDCVSRRKMVLSGRKTKTPGIQIQPGPPSQIPPQRTSGISSLYKTARNGMRAPSTLAVRLPSTNSSVTANATKAAVQQSPLPPTRAQRETATSSASTVPPPIDLRGKGAPSEAMEASEQNQKKLYEAIGTPYLANIAAHSLARHLEAGARVRSSASTATLPPRPAKSGTKKASVTSETTRLQRRASDAGEFLDLTETLLSQPAELGKSAESLGSHTISPPRPAAMKGSAASTDSSTASFPCTKVIEERAALSSSNTISSPRPTNSKGNMEASNQAMASASKLKGLREGMMPSGTSTRTEPLLPPMQQKEKPETRLRLGEYHLKPEEDEGGWQQANLKPRRKAHHSPSQPPTQPGQSSQGHQSTAPPYAEARAKPCHTASGEDLKYKTRDEGICLSNNGLRQNVAQSRGSFAPADNPFPNTIQLKDYLFPPESPSIRGLAVESTAKAAPNPQLKLSRQQAIPSRILHAELVPPQPEESQKMPGLPRRSRIASPSAPPSSGPTISGKTSAELSTKKCLVQTEIRRRGMLSSTTSKSPLSHSTGPNSGQNPSSSIPTLQPLLPREPETAMASLSSSEMPKELSTEELEARIRDPSSTAESLQESISALKARRARELTWKLEALKARHLAAAQSDRLSEDAQSQGSGGSTVDSRDLDDRQSHARQGTGSRTLSAYAPEFYPQTSNGRVRPDENQVRNPPPRR